MEVTKALCLSTSHIQPSTAKLLDSGATLMTVWKSNHGYFIPLYAVQESIDIDLPQDLLNCMKVAHAEGCDFLRLDRDGEQTDELPKYDW